MNTLFVLLGILGLGAVLVAIHVFTEGFHIHRFETGGRRDSDAPPDEFIQRQPEDRRSGQPVSFPLVVNAIVIREDRRILPDRRLAAG